MLIAGYIHIKGSVVTVGLSMTKANYCSIKKDTILELHRGPQYPAMRRKPIGGSQINVTTKTRKPKATNIYLRTLLISLALVASFMSPSYVSFRSEVIFWNT
jgi:hypothetical protein